MSSEYVINKRDTYESNDMRAKLTDFIELKAPNYTDPRSPMLVDVFKGEDDENFVYKTLVLSKFTVPVTGFALLLDVFVGTRPQDATGFLKRLNYWGLPIIGGTVAYTSTVCAVSSLRKKNDQWNHFIAGLVTGSIAGACRKSTFFGIVTGIGTGLLGAAYKDSIIYDYEIHKDLRPRALGFAMSHKMDYTMMPKSLGNWTRGPVES